MNEGGHVSDLSQALGMFADLYLRCCQLGSLPGGSLNIIFLQHTLPHSYILVLAAKAQGLCEQGEVLEEGWEYCSGSIALAANSCITFSEDTLCPRKGAPAELEMFTPHWQPSEAVSFLRYLLAHVFSFFVSKPNTNIQEHLTPDKGATPVTQWIWKSGVFWPQIFLV